MSKIKSKIPILIIFLITYSCDLNENESDQIENYECDNPIDCIEWVKIPQGEYIGGQNNSTMRINYDYYIMKNEITNEQYIYFLNQAYNDSLVFVLYDNIVGYYKGDGIYPEYHAYRYSIFNPENEPGSQFPLLFNNGIFFVDSSLLNHPMDYLSWYGAIAFAEYYGFYLPSTNEWEKAARGNTGYRFPWGNDIDPDKANIWDSGDPFDNGTTPVGFYDGVFKYNYQTYDDSSPYGLHDLIGNVSEWTRTIDTLNNHYKYKGMCWGANWYPDCWMDFSPNSHGNVGLGIGFRCVKFDKID